MLAAACSLSWRPYADASGDFTAEMPSSWKSYNDLDLKRRPVGVLSFVGELQTQDEGIPIGAVINVTRASRTASEMPVGGRELKAYGEGWIAPSEDLFGAHPKSDLKVTNTALGGKDARTYEREFVWENPAHAIKPIPMRLVDVVVRTDKAFYIIEYRATQKLFEKHRPVFERFLKGFAFGPSA